MSSHVETKKYSRTYGKMTEAEVEYIYNKTYGQGDSQQ